MKMVLIKTPDGHEGVATNLIQRISPSFKENNKYFSRIKCIDGDMMMGPCESLEEMNELIHWLPRAINK